jgi:hypothetical protein
MRREKMKRTRLLVAVPVALAFAVLSPAGRPAVPGVAHAAPVSDLAYYITVEDAVTCSPSPCGEWTGGTLSIMNFYLEGYPGAHTGTPEFMGASCDKYYTANGTRYWDVYSLEYDRSEISGIAGVPAPDMTEAQSVADHQSLGFASVAGASSQNIGLSIQGVSVTDNSTGRFLGGTFTVTFHQFEHFMWNGSNWVTAGSPPSALTCTVGPTSSVEYAVNGLRD